jgi:hypothetical protein
MNDHIKHSISEIDRDLAPSWIELNDRVRDLSASLKLKAAGTDLAAEADHLAQETARLCGHVEQLHADVIDLVNKLEVRIPFAEPDAPIPPVETEDVEREYTRIQRENHELRADFKDVLKALFMWRDDPKDRGGE